MIESRRQFLTKGLTVLAGGAASLALPETTQAAEKTPQTPRELFARFSQLSEQVPGWRWPEASTISRPDVAPYLPLTEAEVNAYCQQVENEKGNGIGWGRGVFNRVIMLHSDSPQDHITEWSKAVYDYGKYRGWGDITAWEKAWVYPMMLTAGKDDIVNNRQVKVMANGNMVDIDPIRVDNWAVAANVIERGNPIMAVYMVPWVAGEIHARLPQDTEASELTIGFALNQNYQNLKTGEDNNVVPAIIVRGVATAPVSILYCQPTDNDGNYSIRVTQTRLEPLTGNVTIHLPREGYSGNFSPFIVIRMPVVATNPKGETEVILVPGSDVLPSNPRYAPKHRITEDMLKQGQVVV